MMMMVMVMVTVMISLRYSYIQQRFLFMPLADPASVSSTFSRLLTSAKEHVTQGTNNLSYLQLLAGEKLQTGFPLSIVSLKKERAVTLHELSIALLK